MEKYNVYLVSTDTFKPVKILGRNVSLATAEVLEQIKVNPVYYYIAGFEVGTPEELRLRDLIKQDD